MKARLSAGELLSPEVKPYLKYSAAVHVAAALAAWQIVAWKASPAPSAVYSIDFVGGPASLVTSAGPAAPAAPAAPAKPAPQAQFDEFGRRKVKKHGRFVLPKPSLLRGWHPPKDEEEKPAESAGAQGSTAGTAAAGDAGVSADMPNFPYPWYISQVRQMLWQKWQARMPRQPGECVVVFSLLPNGGVVDLRTESSSGDSAFDIAALSSVQDAAPYPPLPQGFAEPFLKVHVTLRTQ